MWPWGWKRSRSRLKMWETLMKEKLWDQCECCFSLTQWANSTGQIHVWQQWFEVGPQLLHLSPTQEHGPGLWIEPGPKAEVRVRAVVVEVVRTGGYFPWFLFDSCRPWKVLSLTAGLTGSGVLSLPPSFILFSELHNMGNRKGQRGER